MSKSKNDLFDLLPRAGLVIIKPFLVTIKHDVTFLKNLHKARVFIGGYTEDYSEKRKRRARMDAEFATMMEVASKEGIRACLHPSANITATSATATAATTVGDSEMVDSATVDRNNHLLRQLGYDIADQSPTASPTESEDGEQNTSAIDDGYFFQYIANIKGELFWAENLTIPLFNTLFCRVLEARVAWNNNPRPPFDQAEHSRTAKAAQRLLEETAGTDGGFLSDDDETDGTDEKVKGTKNNAGYKEAKMGKKCEKEKQGDEATVTRGVQKLTLYGDAMDLDE